MAVKWVRRALASLDELAEYVARDDPAAAERLTEQIRTSVERLAIHPGLGREGRVPGTRELVIAGTDYIVPYRVRENTVEILRVLHGARKWPARF